MSKDFVPSKADIEAFGQAGTIVNEITGELMKVEPIVSDMERIVNGIDHMVAGMDKMAKAMQPTTVQLNKPKFKKSVGALGSMFKTMAGLSLKAYVIQKLVETLSPLMKILEVFQPILDAVSALLEIMVVSAMKPMYAVLLPLVPKIMELAPLFERIGTLIGQLAVMGLEPLLLLFDAYLPIMEPLLESFAEMLEAFKPLMPYVVMFNSALAYLLVYLAPLITKFIEFQIQTQNLAPLFNIIAQSLSNLNMEGGGLIGMLSSITPLFSSLTVVFGGLETEGTGLFNIMNVLILIISNMSNAFSNLGTLGGGLYSIIANIGQAFWNLMSLGGGLLSVFQNIIDLLKSAGLISGGNTTTTTTPSTPSQSLGGGGLFGNANVNRNALRNISRRGLLRAQEGGTISKPTLLQAGEAGAEELVPLQRKSVVVDKLDDMIYEQKKTQLILEKMVNAQERPRGLKKNVYG